MKSLSNLKKLFVQAKTQKLGGGFLLAYFFFLTFMLLDMVTTQHLLQGDLSQEGNPLAVIWYQHAGVLSFLEIILWPMAVLVAAYLINLKSHFLALWYLYTVGTSHLLGWLTWTTYGTFVFLLSFRSSYALERATGIEIDLFMRPIVAIGLLIGFLIALAHYFISRSRKVY